MAGPTHASANFDPIVSLVMSLLAPPAVRSNRIAQTSRTTARDRFLAGGSPVQIWVARITAKWDKKNRTAWEALSLNRLLSGSVFRRGLPLPHEIRMKAIIPSSSSFCGGSDQDRPVNHEKAGMSQECFSLSFLWIPCIRAGPKGDVRNLIYRDRCTSRPINRTASADSDPTRG
jgi:hypothetical protein